MRLYDRPAIETQILRGEERSMANVYCMFKGKMKCAAPYDDAYGGDPHYVITVDGPENRDFNIVINSASRVGVGGNDHRVYSYIDLHFADPIVPQLKAMNQGLYQHGFPRLDYFQDRSLLDLTRMRLVPDVSQDGTPFDINDNINQILTIDESHEFEMRPYHNQGERKFWKPTSIEDVIVYGFGFLFQPGRDGLHETHMNQGNPLGGGFERSNGTFQDGAVIVQIGDEFAAMFTAFQTEMLPTDASGFPVANAVPFAQFIAR
jgi:uncharacterized protein YukJ